MKTPTKLYTLIENLIAADRAYNAVGASDYWPGGPYTCPEQAAAYGAEEALVSYLRVEHGLSDEMICKLGDIYI